MQSLFAGSIAIHFIAKIEDDNYYMYDVELENVDNSQAYYDLAGLHCTNGTNVLDAAEFDISLVAPKILLAEGFMDVNSPRLSGVVAFEKNKSFINQEPTFEYEDIQFTSYTKQITL